MDYLRRRLVGLRRPLVLLGDFNLRGSVPADRTGWRPLVTGDTFPRHDPRFQIDHVLLDEGVPQGEGEGTGAGADGDPRVPGGRIG